MGRVVGAVGDGARHSQRHAEVVADLRKCGALHFHRQGLGQFALQGGALGGGAHEAVATDDQAPVQPRCLQAEGDARGGRQRVRQVGQHRRGGAGQPIGQRRVGLEAAAAVA